MQEELADTVNTVILSLPSPTDLIRLTTSEIDTSTIANDGDPKSPNNNLFATHCPYPSAFGVHRTTPAIAIAVTTYTGRFPNASASGWRRRGPNPMGKYEYPVPALSCPRERPVASLRGMNIANSDEAESAAARVYLGNKQ